MTVEARIRGVARIFTGIVGVLFSIILAPYAVLILFFGLTFAGEGGLEAAAFGGGGTAGIAAFWAWQVNTRQPTGARRWLITLGIVAGMASMWLFMRQGISLVALAGLLTGSAVVLAMWIPERSPPPPIFGSRQPTPPSTYAEVGTFIAALQVACESPAIGQTLTLLLSQPAESRKANVLRIVQHLRGRGIAEDIVDAFVCFLDDDVAEKAYRVIEQAASRRSQSIPRSAGRTA